MAEQVVLVDTHVHLDMIDEGKHTSQVLERAGKCGVKTVISVGIDLESSRAAVDYSRRYPGAFAAVGIHPNDAKDFDTGSLHSLIDLAKEDKIAGWGEIGLDYFREHTPRDIQLRAFEEQLEAAASLGLPVIIHDRDAHQDCLSVLKTFVSSTPLTGVFHCFSGDKSFAGKVLDLGFFISFTGVVTFPKAQETVEVARFVPLDRIMIETDSPFLSPVPFRGKVNEPARARIIAEKIAEIRGIPLEEVANWTTRNASALFGLKLP